jgi:hypothetical protein
VARAPIHLNDNIMCAVAVKTTGPRPYYHDLVEVTVLPVDSFYQPIKYMLPFNMYLRPMFPERLEDEEQHISKAQLLKSMRYGTDALLAADLFDVWFTKLNLPPKKKISPLTHAWHRTYGFLVRWLGQLNTNHYFDDRVRDVQSNALFVNDYSDYHSESCPYPKVHMTYLCSQSKIPRDFRQWDSLLDAVQIAEIHRLMLRDSVIHIPK